MNDINKVGVQNINETPYLINKENLYCINQPIPNDGNLITTTINITDFTSDNNHGNYLSDQGKTKITIEESNSFCKKKSEKESETKAFKDCDNLFRLFVKNGQYVYAKSNDIIIIESCDHLVSVYLACVDKIKKTIRHNTLKDFLLLLPPDQFIRIGRFCAINMHRLSGGNCKDQTFEFDFKFSVKLKHAIPNTIFNCIGK